VLLKYLNLAISFRWKRFIILGLGGYNLKKKDTESRNRLMSKSIPQGMQKRRLLMSL